MCQLKYYFYPLIVSMMFVSLDINAQSTPSLSELNEQINVLKKKMELLEKEQKNSVKPVAFTSKTSENKKEAVNSKPIKENDLRIYATLRPTFGYIDENGETFWDVRDALSHAGLKSTTNFDDDWSAVLHGEWGIDLSNNGDFGKARQVYVALNSPIGTLGIGKQRPTQYLFIAEYVDIFNHSNSPFAYDPESIFFVDNLITYKILTGNFTWMIASQFNGNSGDNSSDLLNAGISYDKGPLHVAFTYLSQDSNKDDFKMGEDEVLAASLAYEFTNSLYLAVGYQNRNYQRYAQIEDRDGHTFDVSASYKLSEKFRVKLGFFDFLDGLDRSQSQDFNGYNTTLEWLPSPLLRFHIEYLERNFDYHDDFSSISIGFRYDFSLETKY
jgi:predicted porin